MDLVNYGLCILVGFLISFLVLKSSLNKQGAGNCKMCQSCNYKTQSVKGGGNNEE